MDRDQLDRKRAHWELDEASKLNPGRWTAHSEYAAKACENIAAACPDMDSEKAYILGLIHDIGRRTGISKERHLTDGYHYCMGFGWKKAAQISVTHAYMIQDIRTGITDFDMTREDYDLLCSVLETAVYDDYDRLVQLADSLALPTGFCLLEKRFVDVGIRYGTVPSMAERWKKVLEIKQYFDQKTGGSIYRLLPGVMENSF